ncbi:MAG: hypothetical protein SO072_01360 [Dysosmobacter sp.]|nr:hypothetical protein [Dysosmobacter sp.]
MPLFLLSMAHSQDCTFALNAAEKHPDCVKALILVECASLPELGIRGNSHMLMMDDNSADIAELIHQWLVQKGLGVQ